MIQYLLVYITIAVAIAFLIYKLFFKTKKKKVNSECCDESLYNSERFECCNCALKDECNK